jgi:hypothetical protein
MMHSKSRQHRAIAVLDQEGEPHPAYATTQLAAIKHPELWALKLLGLWLILDRGTAPPRLHVSLFREQSFLCLI